uniref:Peptidase C14 caspase domain-containing protein n=1 Tax=viral metagenome TaxID=1070528 RepID=A0A6C0C9Q5_9ZZZZ
MATKHALLIGINYYKNPANQLNGCINDVTEMAILLAGLNYKRENIVIMTDDKTGTSEPTKANILAQIKALVGRVKSGDTVFVHYSGHGSQVRDRNGDELKNLYTPGMDDCICPSDFGNYSGSNGFILDDVLKENLVNQIPVGAKLRAFFDCCHSGSILDLEFIWKLNGIYTKDGAPEKKSDDIIMISGCRDDQTSADAWNDAKRQAGGALTMALVQSITPTITWKNLVTATRKYMAQNGFTQYPLLSVSNQTLGDKVFDI